ACRSPRATEDWGRAGATGTRRPGPGRAPGCTQRYAAPVHGGVESGIRSSRFHPAQADGFLRGVQRAEASRPKPSQDLGVCVLPLVAGRVPVEGVEPAPAPLRMEADRHDSLKQPADHGNAIEIVERAGGYRRDIDRKSTRLNSSHGSISYAVFCLKKK